MIVKNEARHLPACLASISGLVDEIVVVDTGSTDQTREIAIAAGAKLYEYPWHGDFAAARNQALERASGDWILYIDADERVRKPNRPALLEVLRRDDVVSYKVRFHPRPGFTAYPEYRIFRNDPRIRFEGVIHESPRAGMRAVAAEDGRSIQPCAVTIDHVGYEGDQSHKHDRNLPLLLQRTQVPPVRTYMWWHLGFTYRELGQLEAAEAAWLNAIAPARDGSARTREESQCYGELAKLYYDQDRDAMAVVEEGLSYFPENLLLQWIKGRLLAETERYDEAAAIYEALGRVDPETYLDQLSYDVRIIGPGALADRARLAMQAGDKDEASHWFARAARFPRDDAAQRMANEAEAVLA